MNSWLKCKESLRPSDSDLFDVLAHVAYALPPLTRQERADKAKVEISTHFNSKQQVFLDFRAVPIRKSGRERT